MAKNTFLLNEHPKAFLNQERGVTLRAGEKGRLLETIAGNLEAIVDASLLKEEKAILGPLTRFEVKVWPKSAQHQAEGTVERPGLKVSIKDATEMKLVQGEPVPLNAGEDPSRQRFERTSETKSETTSKVEIVRTLAINDDQPVEVRLGLTCSRINGVQQDSIWVEFPRTGLDDKNPKVRIIVGGTENGKFIIERGDAKRIVAAMYRLLQIDISLGKVVAEDTAHILDIAQKIRTKVFFEEKTK